MTENKQGKQDIIICRFSYDCKQNYYLASTNTLQFSNKKKIEMEPPHA